MRRLGTAMLLAAVVAAVLVLTSALVLRVGALNPFASQVEQRNDAVVLTKIQNLARFEAASGHLQTLVELETTSERLPGWLTSDRIVMTAEADVTATVDFSALPAGAIERSADGKSAVVHLPAPTLSPPRLDPGTTRVISHDRGLAERASDALGSGGDHQVAELERRAAAKLADAAATSDLGARARANTERFVTDTLHSVGIDHVTVVWDKPAATPRDGA